MHNNFLKLFNEKAQQYESVIDFYGVMEHFGITDSKIRSTNALRRSRSNMRNPFPVPVKIVGRNYWFYNEIRQWQQAETRYYRKIFDSICLIEEAHKEFIEALQELEKVKMELCGINVGSH